MATQKTNESAAIDSKLVERRVPGNIAGGSVRYFEATYAFLGTEAASGDVIDICSIPVGAVVLPELCRVANEASLGGSDLALPKLGDPVDDDRYSATSVSLHSSNAAIQSFAPNIADGVIARHIVTEATQRIRATFTRTNAPTAAKRLKFLIAYRLAI